MKPRTKEQKHVLQLSKQLKPISEAAKKYAYEHCFEDIGLYKKNGWVWCQCCGHSSRLSSSLLGVSLGCENGYECPECGKKLKLVYHRSTKAKGNTLRHFSLFQAYKGYQVIRTFEISRCNYRNGSTMYDVMELWQSWISEEGKETILGRDYTRSMYHFSWSINSEMNIKNHNANATGYIAYEDIFDITGNYMYARGSVTKLLKRNGWTMDILKEKEIEVIPLMKALIRMDDPFVEELVKHKQYGILGFWQHAGGHLKDRTRWQYAVRICERNNYIVDDGSMYVDYIELLRYFNLDTHNAKYVCPVDLKAAHDKLLEKKNKIEVEKEMERKAKEIEKQDKLYKERMKNFAGLSFGDKDIRIEPLHSVREFAEEGKAMHHCVFAMGYYDEERHPDSLILSAKDKKGKRLETIEVNTKSWKVIQSRAVCNGRTAQHDAIVNMVIKYMPLLKKTACTAK